ncbi:uncharacterized protein LOC126904481 isoform X3 [Daktulosphaira vitifoliae]|uniref:uncharacterized protein LOC126904481 isoform X2 n=1 Tax=Daktulosphaira vitifoliae TaxID=58002 RepID=UPI0021AA3E00|nr:uncharacterized protein LOC126904481 isoform X2 [Daktulosphaira vitifoliae]XP_050539510.1 uncharacterized protein LOC126904481 isoform X3 [Daktulosphaira vitifoliae]
MISISYALFLISLAKTCMCVQIDMNNITIDIAKEHIHYHEKLLPLKIRNYTVYTSAKVFSIKNIEEFYLNEDIDNPVPLDEEYLGSAPRLFYRTPAVGRTLQEITDQAIQEYNDPMEAIVWLRNVIESVGITALIQYSQFTVKTLNNILDDHEKFIDHFNKATTFFIFLSKKFSDYRLRQDPINQIILMFNEYNQSQKLKKDKQKFIKLSNDFLTRFIMCMRLVTMPRDPYITKIFELLQSRNLTKLKSTHDIPSYLKILQHMFYSSIKCHAKMLKDSENTNELNLKLSL